MKVAAWIGLAGILLVLYTGDGSAYWAGKKQPMKLAVMEGVYEGSEGRGLIAVGVLNPEKKTYDDDVEPFLFKIEIPKLLSILATRQVDGFVPGIENIIEGGYTEVNEKGEEVVALSAEDRIERGKLAIRALADYKQARKAGDEQAADEARLVLEENFPHFGYGYVTDLSQLVPYVPLVFYSSWCFWECIFFCFLSLFSFFLIVKALLLTHGCCGYSCFRCRWAISVSNRVG